MKRTLDEVPTQIDERNKKMKEIEVEDEQEEMVVDDETGFSDLGDDLLLELLKHFDARSLGVSACVNKRCQKMVEDERLWEMICNKHWSKIGYGKQQLRSVVTALGGFRRLHSLYVWPLIKASPSSSSSSAVPAARKMMMMTPSANWGKDEINLSLSLLSTSYFEMMSRNNRGSRR